MNRLIIVMALGLILSGTIHGNADSDLCEAAGKGNYDKVVAALKKKARVTCTRGEGYTALMLAASGGHLKIVKLLVSKGADVNTRSGCGTALIEAAKAERIDVIQFLLQKGAKINAKANMCLQDTALISAAFHGQTKSVKFLLAKGADFNAKNGDGQTAIMEANRGGHAGIVELLRAAGAKR